MVHDGCKSTTPTNRPRRSPIGGEAARPLRNWWNSLRQPLSCPCPVPSDVAQRSVNGGSPNSLTSHKAYSRSMNMVFQALLGRSLYPRDALRCLLHVRARRPAFPSCGVRRMSAPRCRLTFKPESFSLPIETRVYLVLWQSCLWSQPQSPSPVLTCARDLFTPTRRNGPADRLSLVNISQTQPGAIFVRRVFDPNRRVCISPTLGCLLSPDTCPNVFRPDFPLVCPLPVPGGHMPKNQRASFSCDPSCIWHLHMNAR
ncbi:uncharacterized protein LY79DRAFT_23055 [Colletotrichum navitas]|uniref:Uncharacterized protein n=1 Tax=Colletotrichum navitas TaxID=681940 RepID=A0AAD8VCV8_9PEZI|nr:uncharacterized protein LY79DRAFT_23055 [Colletotrichum navitas]KAK1600528.1 hypothetical protein LY79DRAFT_23055 [Colletotrichum navitas]